MKKSLSFSILLLTSLLCLNTFACSKKNVQIQTNFQYISGPKKGSKLKTSSTSGKSIDYFFGKSSFNYVSYKKQNGSYVFNGNEENVKKTLTQNRNVTLVNNEEQSEQIILFKENDSDIISDVDISFISCDENNTLIDSVSLIKPIKTSTSLKGDNSHVDNGDFITFDEVADNCLNIMKYDFQPILVKYVNSKSKEITNSSDIIISYKCNGVDESFKINKKINSKINSNIDKNNFSMASMFYTDSNEKYFLKELDQVIKVKNITITNDLYSQIASINKLNSKLKNLIFNEIKKYNTNVPSEFYIDDTFNIDSEKNIIVNIKSNEYRDIDGNHSVSVSLTTKEIPYNEKNKKIIDNDVVSVSSNYDYSSISSNDSFRIDSDNKDVNLNNKVDKALNKLNSDISFDTTDIWAIEPIVHLNGVTGNFEDYLRKLFDYKGITIENIFNNLLSDKNNLTNDFTFFDRKTNYFINKGNIKNIFIDMLGRGSDVFSLYIENPESDSMNKTYYKINIKGELVSTNSKSIGKLTNAGNQYINLFLPKALKIISDHINDTYSNQGVIFYATLDEFSNEIVNKIKNALDAIKNTPIKLHSYAGWQFNIENNLSENEMEKEFDSIDYMTIQIRDIIKQYESTNDSKKTLANYINHRNNMGLQTHLYSSWNDYPGGYIGSNGFELTYGPLLAKSLNATGYNRFELEWFRNDDSVDGKIIGNPHEAGDESLLYTGNDENFNYSLRYINLIEGFDMVSRLNELSNIDMLSLISYKYTNETSQDNIDSKWNFSSNIDSNTIAGQEEIIRNKLNII